MSNGRWKSAVPSRGGGLLGKKMRQDEHDWYKSQKTDRETNFFWSLQEKNLARDLESYGPPRFGEKLNDFWRREQVILFKEQGTSGIMFDQYNNIPVERSGPGDSVAPIENFSELMEYELPEFVRRNIGLCRYSVPTPVQKHAIPIGLSGYDIMCCAQTGSGKTAAFLIPILGSMNANNAIGCQNKTFQGSADPTALVLAPTRELCQQIHFEARKLCFRSPFLPVAVYGGADAKQQLRELGRSADILVATPGRLTDFIDRKIITIEFVRYFVLDEADRMLDMGFEPQIRRLIRDGLAKDRQTLMFSATFPKEIQRLARDFMRDYVWISVGVVGSAVDSVDQSFIQVQKYKKKEALLDLLKQYPNEMTIIFVGMKSTADYLSKWLSQFGMRADDIHGDKDQSERDRSLSHFKNGRVNILVATDVASRGLDIRGVGHVVNFDMPRALDDYVHRIGRTGRIGHTGNATSLFCEETDAPIAVDLYNMLKQAGRPIPPWFGDLVWKSSNKASKSNKPYFSSRDVRQNRSHNGQWSKNGSARTERQRNGVSRPERNGIFRPDQNGYARNERNEAPREWKGASRFDNNAKSKGHGKGYAAADTFEEAIKRSRAKGKGK